jgi:AsmA protein
MALGGKEPATLEGRFDATGYTLHLTGMASPSRLLVLGTALPEFGDGLEKVLPASHVSAAVPVDLTAVHPWAGAQVWTAASGRPAVHHSHRPRRP